MRAVIRMLLAGIVSVAICEILMFGMIWLLQYPMTQDDLRIFVTLAFWIGIIKKVKHE